MPRHPTPYGDLNGVLAELTMRARALLGDTYIGAYLQGSFALGDAHEASDADFVVVVRRDLTADEARALQAMHGELFALPSAWAQHLEGSYFPAAILRRKAATPRDPPGEPRGPGWIDPATKLAGPRAYPLFFLGHGEKTLVRSEHCNTQVLRWILRERGVVLDGPEPRSLIDVVTADDVRQESRAMLRGIESYYLDGRGSIEPLWHQSFVVTLVCRVLYSRETGEVASKAGASAWAKRALEARWTGLIDRAQATWRTEAAVRQGPSDPAEVAATLDFLRYALDWRPAGPGGGMRALLERRLALQRGGPPGHRGGRPGGLDGRGGVGHGRPPAPPTRPGGRGRRG